MLLSEAASIPTPSISPAGTVPASLTAACPVAGDGQRLIQQGRGLLPVAGLVTLTKHIGVVAQRPGQFWMMASITARVQRILKVSYSRFRVALSLWLFFPNVHGQENALWKPLRAEPQSPTDTYLLTKFPIAGTAWM